MSDVCPHRMAPLSQGRIDPHSGCIECPYHGQQFDTKGGLFMISHNAEFYDALHPVILLP